MHSTFDTPGYDGTLNPVLPPGGWGVPRVYAGMPLALTRIVPPIKSQSS